MLTVEARVPTVRASRYLVQFCRHAGRIDHHPGSRTGVDRRDSAPPEVRDVAWSDTLGVVRFGRGYCVLRATQDELLVSVDATDPDELRLLKEGITRRLVMMGRRDQLTVNWRPEPDPTPCPVPGQVTGSTPPPTAQPTPNPQPHRRRRFTDTLLLAGAGALVILVHLGFLGGALAASVWARWGVNLVLALVVIMILVMGGHLVLGRFALRRAPALAAALRRAPWARRWLPPDTIPTSESTRQTARAAHKPRSTPMSDPLPALAQTGPRQLNPTRGITMTEPSPGNCGRQIHRAAHALRAVRNTELENNGITFELWVVMEALAETPGANRERLIHRLTELSVHDQASAERAINELHQRDLITTSTDEQGTIELTTQGAAFSEKVASARTELRAQLYGGIPTEDFATVTRVLELITRRAQAIHAKQ